MKYLLVAHYAGFDLDDPEDLVNSSWFVGQAMTETEAVDLAAKEVEKYINDQIESRFDLDNPDMTDEEKEEIEDYRKRYEVSITNIRIPSDKMETVASIWLDAEYYYEDLKIEVIKLEN